MSHWKWQEEIFFSLSISIPWQSSFLSLSLSLVLSLSCLLPSVVSGPETEGSIAMLWVICRPGFKCLIPRWQTQSPAIHPGGPNQAGAGWVPHLSEANYRCTQTLIKRSKRWGNKSPLTGRLYKPLHPKSQGRSRGKFSRSQATLGAECKATGEGKMTEKHCGR